MGKVMLSGVAPKMRHPIGGILASEIAVGSTVKLMENGVAVDFMVVNQGIPTNSTKYDNSCDGTWLLRKDCYISKRWHSSNVNDYKNSEINSYLNSTYFNLLGSIEQNVIKSVKIPYVIGSATSTVATGAEGLDAKIFLLSCNEVGLSDTYRPKDGDLLSYFLSGSGDVANGKRVALLNNSQTIWWLRSINTGGSTAGWYVTSNGDENGTSVSNAEGIRPALILPSNAKFDYDTLILKGVA